MLRETLIMKCSIYFIIMPNTVLHSVRQTALYMYTAEKKRKEIITLIYVVHIAIPSGTSDKKLLAALGVQGQGLIFCMESKVSNHCATELF